MAAIQALHARGYHIYKIYNGGVPQFRNNQTFFKKKPDEYKGVPDIIAINKKKGHLLFLEMKSSTGRPSEEQLKFMDMVNSVKEVNGAIVNSIDDVLSILK